MRVPATMRWLGLALLGILIAAAVSVAASRLASQQIGLASQPISAGDALAPAARDKPKHRHSGQQPDNRRTTTPSQPPRAPSAPPTSSEPPTYSPPPATPLPESSHSASHDGEHGGSSEGADD